MKLYQVAYFTDDCDGFISVGIFDSLEKAIASCRTETHFYYEMNLNEDLGDGVEDGHAHYPLREAKEREQLEAHLREIAQEWGFEATGLELQQKVAC